MIGEFEILDLKDVNKNVDVNIDWDKIKNVEKMRKNSWKRVGWVYRSNRDKLF